MNGKTIDFAPQREQPNASRHGAWAYHDVPGFCKSELVAELEECFGEGERLMGVVRENLARVSHAG